MTHTKHMAGIYELVQNRETRRLWEAIVRSKVKESYIYNVNFFEQPDRFVLTMEDEDGYSVTVLNITDDDLLTCGTPEALNMYFRIINPSLRDSKISQLI